MPGRLKMDCPHLPVNHTRIALPHFTLYYAKERNERTWLDQDHHLATDEEEGRTTTPSIFGHPGKL